MKIGIGKLLVGMILLAGSTACSGKPAASAPPLSPTPSSTPTQQPTHSFTATPVTPTLVPTPLDTATATPKPISSAVVKDTTVVFVSETIPDGSQQQPGSSLTKTWTIRNGGGATWNTGYDLLLISSNPGNERLGAPALIPLGKEVTPGEEIEISVDLNVPEQNGLYTVVWQLRNEHGDLVFGGELWVTIRVGQASTAAPVVSGSVTAALRGVSQQEGEVSVDFCMQMPDSRAWYPWEVWLILNQQTLTPSGSRIDPATATTPYKCFSFSFPVGASVASGTAYQLAINKIELPPEVHQAENCAYAQQLLAGTYPGLSFTCGGPGYWYTNLVAPPGMTPEQADRLILDAMSNAIYGPWNLSGQTP